MSIESPTPWTGRDDGPGRDHLRWHHVVDTSAAASAADIAFVGFRSDEGVRRNKGRTGAAAGPGALRGALAGMALPEPVSAQDVGDVVVVGDRLEAGQDELGQVVGDLLDGGKFVVVLGGGHEVAYGSYLGLVRSARVLGGARLGVLNLDAHLDLRADVVPSSGTPFRQMAEAEDRRGADFRYAALGLSQPSNTAALFEAADSLGVRYLLDEACGPANRAAVEDFVDDFLSRCDVVHLTIDLDVLPASVAPGVSAPAGFGVALETVQHVCARVAASGQLALCEVAEMNPELDIDGRTARSGARLVHRVLTGRLSKRSESAFARRDLRESDVDEESGTIRRGID